MTKITKIEVQKNNKERFNLFLDEVFEMGIDIDTLVRFNLKRSNSWAIRYGEYSKIWALSFRY